MTFQKNIKEFEKLYKDHFQFLCLVAFQITKSRAVSEDIVQDFFIYLWGREEQTNINVSFNAYATRAVKNLSLQHLEKNKKLALADDKKLPAQEFVEPVVFEKTDAKNSKVRELVNQIPEGRRKIFIAHVVDGLSYAQIAELYDISINTVKTQMKRSYAFLRSIENRDLTAMVLLFLFERW